MAKRKKQQTEDDVLLHKSGEIELDALSLCLKDKKAVDYLLDKNFSAKLLSDYEREFKFIIEHRLKYNKLPSKKIFEIEFPNVELSKPTETIKYYYDAFRQMYEERSTVEFIEKSEVYLQDNKFPEVRREALSFIDKFNTVCNPGVGTTTAEGLNDYISKYTDTRLGVPYPWTVLTKATRGKHRGNFVVYTGEAKAGKTFTVMKDCTNAYDKYDQNVLCISLEMSRYELLNRHYCMLECIHYTRWTRKEYSKREYTKIFKRIKDRISKKKNWFRIETPATSTEFTGSYNMSWVRFLVSKYKPDILWIDGLYLLAADTPQDSGGWKDLQQNSRACKSFMLERNIIGIATVQMGRGAMGKKRKGAKPDKKDIGGTVSYLQDADLVLCLNRQEELRLGGQNQIYTLVARECPHVSVTFNWHLNEMNFDQTLGEIEGEDTLEAIEASEKSDKEVDF